jgi:hypothetical protein
LGAQWVDGKEPDVGSRAGYSVDSLARAIEDQEFERNFQACSERTSQVHRDAGGLIACVLTGQYGIAEIDGCSEDSRWSKCFDVMRRVVHR